MEQDEQLNRFEKAVGELARQPHPEGVTGRATAARALIDQICTAPWRTPAEREKAQGLVTRLLHLIPSDRRGAQ